MLFQMSLIGQAADAQILGQTAGKRKGRFVRAGFSASQTVTPAPSGRAMRRHAARRAIVDRLAP